MTNFKGSILKKALIDESVSQDAYVRKWFSLHREMSFIEVEAILWNLAGGKQGNFKSPDKNTHIFSQEMNFGEFIALLYKCIQQKYHNHIPKRHPIFDLLEGFKTLFVESAQLKEAFKKTPDFPVFQENYFGEKVSEILKKIPVQKKMLQTNLHNRNGKNKKEFPENILGYFSTRVDEILDDYILQTLEFHLENDKKIDEESFYLYAYELYLRGEHMHASQVFKKGLETFPQSTFLMRKTAEFYRNTGEMDACESYFLDLLVRDQYNYEGLLGICEFYFEKAYQAQGEEKIKYLYYIGKYAMRGHLKYKPDTNFYEILGYWYKEKGDFHKACENFLQADLEDINVLKHIAQLSLEIKNYQQSRDFAIMFLKIEPYDTDVWEVIREGALQKGIPILDKIDIIIKKILQNPPSYQEECRTYNSHVTQKDVTDVLMADQEEFEHILDTKSISYVIEVIHGILMNGSGKKEKNSFLQIK